MSVEIIVALIVGACAIVGLVIALVKAIKKAVNEKKYAKLIEVAMEQIEIAEKSLKDGDSKKELVIKEVENVAKEINYDLDIEAFSTLIDGIITLTKQVNTKKVTTKKTTTKKEAK